jgi:hypothetical protein
MNLTRVGMGDARGTPTKCGRLGNATYVCDKLQPPQLAASSVWKQTQRGLLWADK